MVPFSNPRGNVMRKAILGLLAALLSTAAAAQSVQQSGTVTRGHIPYWASNGIISDAGTSADSPITSIGVTGSICSNSARVSSGAWFNLCLGYAGGIPTISVQNNGTATAQPLQFVVNGTTYPFPGSLANITIGTTPVVGGSNSLCLFVSAGVVGQQACTLSAITSLTGDVTATGPGVSAATLATVNVTPGTYGSGALVPIITVNGKGLVTSVTTTANALTVGSTTIAAGTTNGILYNNAGIVGNLATLASSVLSTSVGGVPSLSATLPSGLTIPSPTFTGTETFPDSATWTASGISKVAALSVGSATLPSPGNLSVSGQYQVNGVQITGGNLSEGKTGTGALVGATSPAISGTWTGSPTFSGNITHSGQLIATGTSAPASAGGNTVVMGTLASPTLSNNGQAFLYNTVVNGAIVEGAGSTNDVSLFNKSGVLVFGVPTGTTKLNFPSLSAGTCSSGLALDSGNNTVLVSCPGAAASIQVGATTVTSGTTLNILFNNGGTLGNETIASILTAGSGIGITGTTNATIAAKLPYISSSLSANQTGLTSGSPTKVLFNTTTGTASGQYATGTFTPTLAGTYLVTTTLWCDGTAVTQCLVTIRQTGSNFSRAFAPVAGNQSISFSDLVPVNGSTDTIEIFGTVSCTGTCSFDGGSAPALSKFSAVYVSP